MTSNLRVLAHHLGAHMGMPTAAGSGGGELRVGAHRGAMCHAPENTVAAFQIAIKQGVYRIECDVRQTSDGVLVLMHDDTVDRTTDGTGPLRQMTLSEVKGLRAITGAGGGHGSEPVPTLEEALQCAKGKCRLLVELKDTDIAAAVVRQIVNAGMVGECTISAFHEPSLKICRQESSIIGTCYFCGLKPTADLLSVEVHAAHVKVGMLPLNSHRNPGVHSQC
jgi:glycerophosphoryl diester phosphodiesterase